MSQKTLLPYLVIRIVVPAVANVPEPGFAPQTDEPVHKDGAVEHPPKNDERLGDNSRHNIQGRLQGFGTLRLNPSPFRPKDLVI